MVAMRKIPTAEPGIEPGTSWIVVRSSDHQATRLVALEDVTWTIRVLPHVTLIFFIAAVQK
jgi:hypothetical protein